MDNWQKRNQWLYFFGIGRLPLQVVSLTTPYAELPSDLASLHVSRKDIPPECDAAFVDGHPYEVLPPAIRVADRMIRYCSMVDTRFLIGLRGTYGDYLRSFSRKSRHNILNEKRRLVDFSGGALECRFYGAPADMRDFRNIAVAISDKTYQRRLGFGFNPSPDFVDSLMADAACGLVRGYILWSAGIPLSFAFCRVNGATLRYVNVGYDPEYSKWSPGRVLMLMLLEQLFEEGRFDWLDLEYGAYYDYKVRYATRRSNFVQLWYFPVSVRNFVIVSIHLAIRRTLTRLASVKRFLRRVAGSSRQTSRART